MPRRLEEACGVLVGGLEFLGAFSCCFFFFLLLLLEEAEADFATPFSNAFRFDGRCATLVFPLFRFEPRGSGVGFSVERLIQSRLPM